MARSAVSKKLQLARAWASGHPVWCAWQVNYRCNFRCSFCHYWRDPMGDQPELSVEDFRRGSRKLAGLGSLLISLAGGEPLVRPDIVEIVAEVAQWHFPFVTTNGWFSNQGLADELFAAGLWGVSISIDYADAQRHDRRRGMPGAFERALSAVEQTGSRRFVYADDGAVGAHLLALRRKYSNILSNPYFLSRFDQALNGGVPGCLAGRGFFNIDSTGDIAACVEQRGRPVANLFEHPEEEIVRRLRADESHKRCRACWYNCRGEIEALYNLQGLWMSLPTLLFDRGRPPVRGLRPREQHAVQR